MAKYNILVGVKLDSNSLSSLRDKLANRKDIKIPVGVKIDASDIQSQIHKAKIKPIEVDLKISNKSLSNIKSQLNKTVSESIGKNSGSNRSKEPNRSKGSNNVVKKQSEETIKTFNTLLSLQGRINKLHSSMDGLSGDELVKAQARLDKLTATYSRLYGTVAKKLDVDQIEKLNQRASASIPAVKQTINAWEELKRVTKEVGNISTKLTKLKADPNVNFHQIEELEIQLKDAKKAADDLRASLSGQLSTGQYQKLNNELVKTEKQIREIESSIADRRAKLAGNTKAKLDSGAYKNDLSKITNDYRKLDNVYGNTKASMKEFIASYRELRSAFRTKDKDIDRQIAATERYKAALESVKNQLDINKREESARTVRQSAQERIDYEGNKALMSSKKWIDENSAAKEQYGETLRSYEEDIRKAMEIGDKAAIESAKRNIELTHMKAELDGKTGLNFGDKIKNQFKRYGTYLMSSLSLWEVVRGLQMMYENVKAVDKAMVELKRVTDLSEAQYAVLYDDMTASAREYGAALDDIINATAGWARLGFDANASKELAEITTMYQHIADIDVETANNNLVTAFNGNKEQLMSEYGNEVDAMMHVADVYNELGNKFAINSEQVGSGVSRAASALALAGNTLEETSAMVTAITEVTQDPEKAGNALKVVSMRVRGMAGDLEDLGEEVDENVENISKMQGKILNLTNGRVNIFDDNGDFRDFYDIMLDIAKIWDTLTSTDQATLLETIAGKHRANDVAAYFDNYERGIKAVNDAYNSAGSAEEEHAKYMDGLEGRLNSLTAAWQEFSNDFLSSGFLKFGINVLTKFVNVIDDLVNKLGLLGTVGTGFTIFSIIKNGGITKSIDGMRNAFSGLADSLASGHGLIPVLKNARQQFTLFGKLSVAAAVVGVISAITQAYENYQAEQQKLRQETIDSSNEFLDSADTFEQAYAKYANKTILTSEEESDLASAVDGTVAALGDKSSALQSVVSSSDDYLNSLDAIAKAELEQSKRSASDALKAANEQLEKDAGDKGGLFGTGFFSLSNKPAKTAIEIPDADLEEYKALKDILESPEVSKYISTTSWGTKDLSGRGHTYYTFDADAGLDSLIDQYYTAVEIKNKLNDEGLTDSTTYEDAANAVDTLSSSIQEAITQTYNFQKANYELENGIPSTIEEFYAMREAVLSSATDSVEARQQMAETMNEEFGDIFDLSSIESQMNLIDSVTKNVQGMNDEKLNTFETFFDIKTKLNDGECTVGEYSNAIAEVNDAISQVENKDAQEFLRLQLGLEIDENGNVKDEVMKLRDKLIRDFENSGVDSDIAASVADSLNKSELKAAIQLVANGKIDMSNIDSDEVKREIEKQAKLNEAIRFTVNIDVESKNLENLNTAITESLSGTGLGTESITAVKKMFEGLEGYDPSKLFERTANGMRLNTIELKKMNDEYKATNLNGLDNKLSALGNQYNQTKEELYGLTYGTDEYNEKARQLSDIEAQINAAEQLAAQYEGLTSAYNEWQMAESAGTQRDMYEKVIEGFKNVEDEISRGWYDDSTVEFIEMLSGKDLSSGNINKIKSAWKGLGKTIEGTSYSVKDFFTVNDDGDSTNTGVYNFLEAVDAKFDKKGIIKKDGSGNIIGFDFKVAGGDEAIAEALGVSKELVQIMVRASDDAGFVVSMDGTYQQLDVLKEKAQEAANTLKEMFKGTENEITADFDLNTDNVEDIKTQLENANAVWEKFKNIKNEDGTINMGIDGAEEAFTLVSTLQTMLDQLSEPVYMDVEVSKVSKELQEPLTQLQEYERLTQQEHQLNLKGTDTSSLQKSKNDILNYLEGLDPTIKANLGIEGLSKDELQKKIDDREVKIPATIDLQVEMNNTLRDMINVSLYNSGLITKEELEKRVDVNVYAENVDASDVDQKTEEAVENSSNQDVEVNTSADVNVEAGNVNTDSVEQGVNNAVENAFVGDGGYLYTTNTNVNVGVDNVNTFDAEQDVNNAVDNAFVGDGGYLYTISTNVDVEAGNVDTSSAEQEVDNAVENAFVGDGGYLYTTDTNVNISIDNVDTSTAEQELNNVMNDTFVGDGGFVFDAKTDVNVDAGDVDTTNVESALTNVFNRQWFDDNISLGDNGIYVDYELEPSSTADPMDAFDNGVVVGDNGIIIDYTLKPEVEESPVENYFSDQVIGDAGFVIDYALEPEEQANPMDAFDNGVVVGDNGIIIDYTLKPEEAELEIEPEPAKNYFADDVIGDNGVIIDYTLEPAEQENPMDAFDNSVVIGDNGMVIDYLFNADVDVSNQDELTTLEQNIASLDDKEVKVLAKTFGEPSVETLYNAMGKLRDADVVAVAEAVGTGDVERLDGVLAGLTDEQIQAVCDVYGCEDAEELRSKVGSLTDKEIQALAKVMGTMDVDTLRASVEEMHNKEVEAKANVSGQTKVDSLRDSLNLLDMVKNIGINISVGVSGAINKLQQLLGITGANGDAKIEGTARVIGSAYASGSAFARGTAGNAFAQGDWGVKGSGVALGGEVGQELVVRNGRWFTIGDNGAEFFKYQPNDIIFNAGQTKQLFEQGKIVNGRTRGMVANANGTAFASGRAFYTGPGSTGDGGGGKVGGGSGGSRGSGGSDNGKSSKDKDKEKFDWIERAIKRLERAISKLDTTIDNAAEKWSTRNKKLEGYGDHKGKHKGKIDYVKDKIDVEEQGAARYKKEAKKSATYRDAKGKKRKLSKSLIKKIENGTIDIQELEDTAKKEGSKDNSKLEAIKEYQQWFDKFKDCKQAARELRAELQQLYKLSFDNVVKEYEGLLSVIEHKANVIDKMIARSEARGNIVSDVYYKNSNNVLKEEESNLLEEYDKLVQKRKNALYDKKNNPNGIKEGSEEDIEMVKQINDVWIEILDKQNQQIENLQKIREIENEIFELKREAASGLIEESDFFIDLFSIDKLYDKDNGQLTKQGWATMGLHGMNYNVNMSNADEYAKKIAEADKKMKEAAKNGFDSEFGQSEKYWYDEKNKWIGLQRDSIKGAKEEKEAIRDMVEEGINVELDALQKLIDKKQEEIDSEKDLYDYQKKVKDQTKEISKLEKQMAAYQNDNSEEAKAKLQELKVSLEEAKENLKETEYDKYISDSKEMLDDLYDKYEEILNKRLDNIDALVSDMISDINANASEINKTISEKADSVGTTVSEEMKNVWTSTNVALSTYSGKFESSMTGVSNAIQSLAGAIDRMKSGADNTAKTELGNKANLSIGDKNNPKNEQGQQQGQQEQQQGQQGQQQQQQQQQHTKETYPYGKASKTKGLIQLGSSGKDVKAIQYALNKLGYKNSGTKKVDGVFGSGTQSAVKAFQKKMGISVDGIVGDKTRAKFAAKKYATGKKNFLADEIAWTQENGPEAIIRPSDGAILTPLAKGDSVLNATATGNIWDMANSPADFIKNNLSVDAVNPNASNSIGNSCVQNFENISFVMPNVKNYDQMLAAMQKDKNFERLINAMTVDQIAGKSSLSKGKAIR